MKKTVNAYLVLLILLTYSCTKNNSNSTDETYDFRKGISKSSIISTDSNEVYKYHLIKDESVQNNNYNCGEFDSKGYLWLGKQNSLIRYNGYDFKKYNYHPYDEFGIPAGDIRKIQIDKNNKVWFLSSGFIYRFDPSEEKTDIVSLRSEYSDNFYIYNNRIIVADNYGMEEYDLNGKFLKSHSASKKNRYIIPEKLKSKILANNSISLANIGDFQDTVKKFHLKQKTKFIVIATSEELNKGNASDYGGIYNEFDSLIPFHSDSTLWNEGDYKNRIIIDTITLQKGRYKLKYHTDDSHSWNKWNAEAPKTILMHGIKLIPFSNEFHKIKTLFEKETFRISNPKLIHIENEIAYFTNSENEFITFNLNNGIQYKNDKSTFERIIDSLKISYNDNYIGAYENPNYFDQELKSISLNINRRVNENLSFINHKGKNYQLNGRLIIKKMNDQYYCLNGTDSLFKIYKLNLKNDTLLFKECFNSTSLMFSNYGNTIMDRSGNIFHLGYSGVEKFSKLKFTIHYKNDNNNTLYGRIVGGTSGMGNSLPYSKPILDKKNNLLYINKKTISIFNTSTFSFKHISHDSVIRSVTKDSIYAKASRDSIKVLMKNSSQQKLQLEKIDHTISDKLYENIFGLYCKLNSTIVLSENKGTYFSMISQQNNLLVKLNYSGKVQPIYKATILGNEFIDDSKKDQLIIFSLDKIITVKDTVVKVNRMRLPSILYSSFSKELKGHLCLFNGGIGIYNYKKFDTIYFDEDTSNYSSGSNFAKYKNKTWIATRKYLFSIDHTTKKVAKIKLFDKKLVRDKVREVQLISNELFDRFDLTFYNKKALLSTQVSGLWIYDFTTSNWKTISLSDGLLDNKIVKMNVVKNEAFLIMDNGISVVDLKSYLIRNYRFDTPLNNKSGHLMENVWEQDFVFGNKILIPGDHSHYAFDLDKLNKIMPYVQLENLLINQSKPISNKNLFEQSKLTFSYNENDLSGTFVGIELSDPEQNKYAYRLKGFNNHWKVVSSKDRNFEFTNIPPGNYVLEIMASNNDGYWSEPYKLEIEILPPFWQTIWFRILIGLSIVLFLFLLYRWRTSAMRNRQKQLENTVHERTREVVHQKELIEEKQKEITDSINYAKRIQYSLLAHDDLLDKNLPEHFVLFKPKDIVSGDFYWATEKLAVDSGSKQFYLAVCDSTGHGVPGAFMSLLNISFLNEGINEKNIIEPNKVFDHVRNRLTENMDGGADGMDAILIQIDFEKKIMNYTAANNAPLLIRNNTIQELQKDKMPVGRSDKNNPFQLFNLTLEKGDCLYFYTDGYADQFGGEKGKKFKYANLNKLLMEIHQLPLSEQNEKLIVAFEKWRGDLEQVDDVCVIGIRI